MKSLYVGANLCGYVHGQAYEVTKKDDVYTVHGPTAKMSLGKEMFDRLFLPYTPDVSYTFGVSSDKAIDTDSILLNASHDKPLIILRDIEKGEAQVYMYETLVDKLYALEDDKLKENYERVLLPYQVNSGEFVPFTDADYEKLIRICKGIRNAAWSPVVRVRRNISVCVPNLDRSSAEV